MGSKLALAAAYIFGIFLIIGSASSPVGKSRFVLIEGNSGVVALPRREADRNHAMYLIRQKCPNGFLITKEAEEVIGIEETEMVDNEKQKFQQKRNKKLVREDKTEYRIYYQCR